MSRSLLYKSLLVVALCSLAPCVSAQVEKGPDTENSERASEQGEAGDSPFVTKKKVKHLVLPDVEELTESELGELWRNLENGDWESRETATRRLLTAGPNARFLLERGLKHPDPEVRLRCSLVIRWSDLTYSNALGKLAKFPMARRSHQILLELRQDRVKLHDAALRQALTFGPGRGTRKLSQIAMSLQLLSEFAVASDTEKIASLLNRDFGVGVSGIDSPIALNSMFYSLLIVLRKLPRDRVTAAIEKILFSKGAEMNAFPRVQALIALSYIGDRTCLPVLKRLLVKAGTSIKIACLQAIEQIAETGNDLEFLRELVADEDEDVCRRSCRLLGRFGVKSAVPELKKALERDSEAIQVEAITSLGLLADASVSSSLKLFAFPKLPVTPSERKDRLRDLAQSRGFAIWALARIKAITELELLRLIEADENLEYMAILGLAELNSDKSFNMLRTLTLRTDEAAEEKLLGVMAIRVMGKMSGNDKVKEHLFKLCTNKAKRAFRLKAVHALRDHGDKGAVKYLIKLATQLEQGRYPQVLAAVFRALGKLQDKEALAPMLRRFYEFTSQKSSFSDMQRSSYFGELLEALGNFGGEKVVKALKKLELDLLVAKKPSKVKEEYELPASRKDGKAVKRIYSNLYRDLAWACAHAGDNSMVDALLTDFYNARDVELFRHIDGKTVRSDGDLNNLGIMLLYGRYWDRARYTFNRQQWFDDRGRTLNVQVYNLACTNSLTGDLAWAQADIMLAYFSNKTYWNSDLHWRHFSTDLDLAPLNQNVHYRKLKAWVRMDYFFRQPR